MKRHLISLLLASLLLPACQGSRAGEGAAHGAFYGAVSSGVVAAVFGGDVGKSMQYGAVGGAVTGGLSGAAADSQQAQHESQQAKQQELSQQNAKLQRENHALQLRQELMERIGKENTDAIAALVHCQHDQALVHTRRAASQDDPNYRLASLWIDAAIALDRRDTKTARGLYPTIVAQDERTQTVEEAEARALDLVTKLEDTRAEFGLPRRCK
jgi:hypothetical protein